MPAGGGERRAWRAADRLRRPRGASLQHAGGCPKLASCLQERPLRPTPVRPPLYRPSRVAAWCPARRSAGSSSHVTRCRPEEGMPGGRTSPLWQWIGPTGGGAWRAASSARRSESLAAGATGRCCWRCPRRTSRRSPFTGERGTAWCGRTWPAPAQRKWTPPACGGLSIRCRSISYASGSSRAAARRAQTERASCQCISRE
mmetsp:Transcript_440/g.1488  ORF Transcript_440/g.1488 Transcript_440/m.1488 type:complete len:201 (-) Transcript_440:129-731(-)